MSQFLFTVITVAGICATASVITETGTRWYITSCYGSIAKCTGVLCGCVCYLGTWGASHVFFSRCIS